MRLPDGLIARAPRLTDATAIFELLADYNTRLTGSPDATPAGVAAGLTAPGFVRGTSYFQMRIDHTEPTAVPTPPAGVALTTGLYDEEARRAAYAVLAGGFADQEADAMPPYNEWADDWSRVALATLDGNPVAAIVTEDTYAETERCGYVARLAVLPEARGRGLGRFLLQHTFAVDAAAGLTGTMLDVDSNNPTPALGLYESVGLRTTRVSDDWSLEILTT